MPKSIPPNEKVHWALHKAFSAPTPRTLPKVTGLEYYPSRRLEDWNPTNKSWLDDRHTIVTNKGLMRKKPKKKPRAKKSWWPFGKKRRQRNPEEYERESPRARASPNPDGPPPSPPDDRMHRGHPHHEHERETEGTEDEYDGSDADDDHDQRSMSSHDSHR